jgi:hypothetical protein
MASKPLELMLAAPEQYRNRARSVATLLATVAGALLTGLSLQALPTLSDLSRWLVLSASTMLIVATCFFVSASLQVSDADDVDDADLAATVKTVVDRIRKRTKWGSRIAVVAAVALVVSTILSFAFKPDSPASVSLTDSGLQKARTVCPLVSQRIEAVRVESISGADPLVTVYIRAEACSKGDPRLDRLILPRADIAAIVSD